ncbi:sensor histidine kinase [Alkalihalobacterium chitinilyticum]|uniref:histidine kinase n=1 Tax=Alkalihalobacterium chitinilyticum TaxID=2980103 RepID=A0ABT5VDE9_9BACI|nr:ATP-binding protein [Alkalihalobacterium chitinilyticum]MDE5413482.1 ATP-binding protein [Alkalihalobacterium chitinilyticum]
MRFKRNLNQFIKRKLMWKLTLINSIVIGLVIWLVGISVKDYACYLIEKENALSVEQRLAFIEGMDTYLLFAVILSVIIAAVIHFYFISRLLDPLHSLTNATTEIIEGKYPQLTENTAQDEIGQLTLHFNEMVNYMKKIEENREKITRDVAHELRTPLTNINGYLEALSTGVIKGDKDLFQSLHEESLRLTHLVEQLRQINKWNVHEQDTANYEWVSMKSLLEQALHHFQMELQKEAIIVDLQLCDATLFVNKNGLLQVIYNLIENVHRYDQGKWMRIKGGVNDQQYKLQISNEGLPIQVADSDQPFERFYRAEASRNRNTGGSGLGLSIVKEIIESHNGEVGFSTENNIHTFWFTIPLSSSQGQMNDL